MDAAVYNADADAENIMTLSYKVYLNKGLI